MNGADRAPFGKTAEQLLEEARACLQRLAPAQAHAAASAGASLIDIRSEVQRERDGVISGSRFITRNVLEWRCDPASPWRDPSLDEAHARLILICNEGYQSSLAAATLQQLGLVDATDVIGGFQAWRAAGLPVRAPKLAGATRAIGNERGLRSDIEDEQPSVKASEPLARDRRPGQNESERHTSTTDIPVDVDVLREEIRKTYTEVSSEQDKQQIFPTGRSWARELGYPEPELSRVPDASVESFAGVANHWTLRRIGPGEVVLDLGCGAGTDLLIAAQMTGRKGRAIGVDMTPAMLAQARASAQKMGLANVALHEALIESLPIEDASIDVVISNGVIDLVPDKHAVLDEIDRVLRPGGRLQVADVEIRHEVSEDARKRIDLWTG